MVSHGNVTHGIDDHCRFCDEVKAEFDALPKKILFLDIDGVVNSATSMKAQFERLGKGAILGIDQTLADEVRRIIEFTQCEVVLSSSWRLSDKNSEQVRREVCEFIDKTPNLLGRTDRGCEVQAWLEAHPWVTDYAILDDNSDFHKDQFLFKTSWEFGITRDITIAVIKHLNGAS